MSTPTQQKHHVSFAGLSIRTSLLLGFGAMIAVMLLATAIAIISSTRVSQSLNVILDQRLPATVQILRVARAMDALVASGVQLASINTDSDRQNTFSRVDNALDALQRSLSGISSGTADIRRLANELTDNLHKLRNLANQRIDIELKKLSAREQLLSNLQAFQQQLIYRVRILEGDNDVIRLLLSRPSPPMDQIAEMALRSAHLTPASRFYTEIETIAGRTLVAIQDPALTRLAISRQVLQTALNNAGITFKKVPADIAASLTGSFSELKQIVLAEDGLLALRERELSLAIESQQLIAENHHISVLVDSSTRALVNGGLDAIDRAGLSANEIRQRYMLILLIATGIGLAGIVILIRFHVFHNVILRLSSLSEAMRFIAAGKLDTPLPPTGDDELGHLGFAVHQFQKTAIEADRRETALRISNENVEKARSELEQKAAELEQVNRKLKELSITDFLTGLANRRRFDEALETEWTRAMRIDQPLTLIMIDVDHFKKYNDRYGHQAGDECLRKLASVLMDNLCRTSDVVARYGGEEFSIISAYTDLQAAQQLAQRIRLAVESLALTHEDSSFGVVTISLGIAVAIPDQTHSTDDLIRAADQALYDAKAGGRNCIKTASLTDKETQPVVDN